MALMRHKNGNYSCIAVSATGLAAFELGMCIGLAFTMRVVCDEE
jgi:hypothetical protein